MKKINLSIIFSLFITFCSSVHTAARDDQAAQAADPQAAFGPALQQHLTYGKATPSYAEGRIGPDNTCKPKIISLLTAATQAAGRGTAVVLKLSLYSLTDDDLVNGIRRAAQAGARVLLILDYASFQKDKLAKLNYLGDIREWSLYKLFQTANVTARWIGTAPGTPLMSSITMHEKVGIFKIGDATSVIMGSYNWSYMASTRNFENCLEIKTEPRFNALNYLTTLFENRFDALWGVARAFPADTFEAPAAPAPDRGAGRGDPGDAKRKSDDDHYGRGRGAFKYGSGRGAFRKY